MTNFKYRDLTQLTKDFLPIIDKYGHAKKYLKFKLLPATPKHRADVAFTLIMCYYANTGELIHSAATYIYKYGTNEVTCKSSGHMDARGLNIEKLLANEPLRT